MNKFEDLSTTKKHDGMDSSTSEKIVVATLVIGSIAAIGYFTRDASDENKTGETIIPSAQVMEKKIVNGTHRYYNLEQSE